MVSSLTGPEALFEIDVAGGVALVDVELNEIVLTVVGGKQVQSVAFGRAEARKIGLSMIAASQRMWEGNGHAPTRSGA